MFHIDATFEDLRMIATSKDGSGYNVKLVDGCTGEESMLPLTAEQLGMVVAINLHNDGEPEGYEKFYEVLEPLLAEYKVPRCCRPIP